MRPHLRPVWNYRAVISASGEGVPLSGLQSRRFRRAFAVFVVLGAVALGAASAGTQKSASRALPEPVPAIGDYQLLSASTTPPSEAACFARLRRCFTPTSMENSYNLP